MGCASCCCSPPCTSRTAAPAWSPTTRWRRRSTGRTPCSTSSSCSAWTGSTRSTGSSSTSTCWGWSAATGTPPPTTSSPPSSWSGSTAAAPRRTLPARRALLARHGRRAGALPPAADGAAPSHRRVRRRPQPCNSADGWWGVGGLGPARARRVHQPARRVPVAARRVGAVGGAGDPERDVEPGLARVRLDPRGRDGARRGRHRQPLGARRGRRLAGGRGGLVRQTQVACVTGSPNLRETPARPRRIASNRPVANSWRSLSCGLSTVVAAIATFSLGIGVMSQATRGTGRRLSGQRPAPPATPSPTPAPSRATGTATRTADGRDATLVAARPGPEPRPT